MRTTCSFLLSDVPSNLAESIITLRWTHLNSLTLSLCSPGFPLGHTRPLVFLSFTLAFPFIVTPLSSFPSETEPCCNTVVAVIIQSKAFLILGTSVKARISRARLNDGQHELSYRPIKINSKLTINTRVV